jgi:hypothetical protein
MNLIIAGGIKVMLKDSPTLAIINDPISERTLKVRPTTVGTTQLVKRIIPLQDKGFSPSVTFIESKGFTWEP